MITIEVEDTRAKQLFENLENAGENLKKMIKLSIEQLNKKYNKRVQFDLELMFERSVEQFYESYEPHTYSRQFGLLKACRIIADDDEWSIEYGPEFITGGHKVGNDYIYVNSFEQGYHGGAIDGPDHPEPGTPWWRLHSEWYRPATRGPSPLDLLLKRDPQGYINEQEKAYSDELVKMVMPYIEQYNAALNEFYGR